MARNRSPKELSMRRSVAIAVVATVLLGPSAEPARADFLSLFKDKPNVVRQGFPARKADPNDLTQSETAWEIEWSITSPNNGHGKADTKPSSVLAIRSAKFMFKDSAGKVRWFNVLKNLE